LALFYVSQRRKRVHVRRPFFAGDQPCYRLLPIAYTEHARRRSNMHVRVHVPILCTALATPENPFEIWL